MVEPLEYRSPAANGNTLDQNDPQQASMLLSAIVDSSEDAIISKDLNGMITSWNAGAAQLFGYTADEAVGRPVASLLIPEDRQDEEPAILEKIGRGERVSHFETKRRRKDGMLLDISLTISPVKDNTGRIIGASKIARDITEQVTIRDALRAANEALRRLNGDLEQFVYSASHDLQEPLRMVGIYTEMVRNTYGHLMDARGQGFLCTVIDASNRMIRLLADLRTYTHASMANEAHPAGVDANLTLQRVVANLRATIDEAGAQISAGPLPAVAMHEFQLEQILQNLIGNAIRYKGTASPVIRIEARRDDSKWCFSVQDNGIGIKPEYKEKIFDLFSRLHTNSDYPGNGMGLAICRRITERVGGRIWAESTPGKGSTFYFTVPAGDLGGPADLQACADRTDRG